ncbi:hypothetical protein BDW69DRAFT_138914 [Aspergillus filifer]
METKEAPQSLTLYAAPSAIVLPLPSVKKSQQCWYDWVPRRLPQRHLVADVIIRLLSLVLFGNGVTWYLFPVHGIRLFGLTASSDDAAILGPALGGRNAAGGLSLLAISLCGHRKLAASFIACWATFSGLIDSQIVVAHGTNWQLHVTNMVIAWLISVMVWI